MTETMLMVKSTAYIYRATFLLFPFKKETTETKKCLRQVLRFARLILATALTSMAITTDAVRY